MATETITGSYAGTLTAQPTATGGANYALDVAGTFSGSITNLPYLTGETNPLPHISTLSSTPETGWHNLGTLPTFSDTTDTYKVDVSLTINSVSSPYDGKLQWHWRNYEPPNTAPIVYYSAPIFNYDTDSGLSDPLPAVQNGRAYFKGGSYSHFILTAWTFQSTSQPMTVDVDWTITYTYPDPEPVPEFPSAAEPEPSDLYNSFMASYTEANGFVLTSGSATEADADNLGKVDGLADSVARLSRGEDIDIVSDGQYRQLFADGSNRIYIAEESITNNLRISARPLSQPSAGDYVSDDWEAVIVSADDSYVIFRIEQGVYAYYVATMDQVTSGQCWTGIGVGANPSGFPIETNTKLDAAEPAYWHEEICFPSADDNYFYVLVSRQNVGTFDIPNWNGLYLYRYPLSSLNSGEYELVGNTGLADYDYATNYFTLVYNHTNEKHYAITVSNEGTENWRWMLYEVNTTTGAMTLKFNQAGFSRHIGGTTVDYDGRIWMTLIYNTKQHYAVYDPRTDVTFVKEDQTPVGWQFMIPAKEGGVYECMSQPYSGTLSRRTFISGNQIRYESYPDLAVRPNDFFGDQDNWLDGPWDRYVLRAEHSTSEGAVHCSLTRTGNFYFAAESNLFIPDDHAAPNDNATYYSYWNNITPFILENRDAHFLRMLHTRASLPAGTSYESQSSPYFTPHTTPPFSS